MTRSKGPVEELSLPPTRMRKDVPTTNEGKEDAQEAQANVQSQQRTADTPSPFAGPGSRAGTSTTPTSETGMLPAASTPFAQPNSRAGLTPQKPTSPQSSLSSTSDQQMQEDENTSVSWDLVDTDTDAEVANINLAPTHRAVTNQNCADSINKTQCNAVGLNHELNTLYNQDFFVADTTGRRLSQIVDKSNYSSLLPNGNAALQLRLPDLLIYLKTDTYLIDVKTGHHYAVYHNRIEKMSVLPKLYAAWPYRQLLQAIHDDAVHFGVNSPEPDTSKQSAPAMQLQRPLLVMYPLSRNRSLLHASRQLLNTNRRASTFKCRRRCSQEQNGDQVLRNHMAAANAAFTKVTVLEDLMWQEPHNTAHYKEVQRIQRNQHIQVAIKLQHMLEAENEFRHTAGLPQLDLPEHLWRVRNMDTALVREQHSMAISTEVEVLCQQLKGKGVYPAPPNYTHITQQNVHFRPIQPANLSPLQHQDRLFFDPLLSTRTGSTGSQSDCVSDPTQGCHSTSPTVHTPSPCMQGPAIPPTPYVNQAAVEQHIRTQSPSVPPRNLPTVAAPPKESPGTSVAKEPLITLATSQQTPPQAQKQLTRSPQQQKKSKSKDGQGVKQSKNINPTDNAPVCWRCGEPGHKKRDCRKQPFCGKCRKEGHVPALCPLGKGPTLPSQLQQQADKFSIPANRCIHCGGAHVPNSCPVRYQPKATSGSSNYGSPKQNTRDNNVASAQVRGNQSHQVSPLVQQNTFAQPIHSNSFPPHPYFPIPFPPPPVPPSNASVAPSAPASDLSAAISLMTNITDTLQRTTMQFVDALHQTIQRGVEAQAEENRNARLDKQFDKIKIFDGSNPAECHPWLEEVHALCSQTGRSFKEMLLLCARQAVRDFI